MSANEKRLFTIFAFVACNEKSEEQVKQMVLPDMTPNTFSCFDNSGMTIEIKSDIPSRLIGCDWVNYDTDEDFYDTGLDTDVYSMTQTDEYTYELTIKPFNEKIRMAFYFKAIDNLSNKMPSVVLIGCGQEISDETKDMLEKYY